MYPSLVRDSSENVIDINILPDLTRPPAVTTTPQSCSFKDYVYVSEKVCVYLRRSVFRQKGKRRVRFGLQQSLILR